MNDVKLEEINGFLQASLGNSLYMLAQKRRHLCISLPQGGHFVQFQYCACSLCGEKVQRVQIVCNDSRCAVVTDSKTCRDIADKLDQSINGYLQFYRFCKELLETDVEELIAIEDCICAFEDGLLMGGKTTKTATQTIVNMRRSLLGIKRYYEQLQYIMNQLCDEDGVLQQEIAEKFSLFSGRLIQLVSMVQGLQGTVSECSETYQAQIGIQQNNLMKIFTIITTIFMPLTVIVGWYGMNFVEMPELHWRYGYLYVIALSLVVCGICVWIFNRKKWFD